MKLLRKLTTLATVSLLMGCASLTGIGVTDFPQEVDPVAAACIAFKPISWSTRDTDATILEVKQHNAVWKVLCEAGK